MHTDPDIIETFILDLRQGRDSYFDHAAAKFQDSIGRLQFHKGSLALLWATAQKQYFESNFGHTRKRQTKWMAKLIARINKLNMELWENRYAIVGQLDSKEN